MQSYVQSSLSTKCLLMILEINFCQLIETYFFYSPKALAQKVSQILRSFRVVLCCVVKFCSYLTYNTLNFIDYQFRRIEARNKCKGHRSAMSRNKAEGVKRN